MPTVMIGDAFARLFFLSLLYLCLTFSYLFSLPFYSSLFPFLWSLSPSNICHFFIHFWFIFQFCTRNLFFPTLSFYLFFFFFKNHCFNGKNFFLFLLSLSLSPLIFSTLFACKTNEILNFGCLTKTNTK